jgi:hypothetical protein
MKNSTNNCAPLLIIAIALSAVFAFLHFTDNSNNSSLFLQNSKNDNSKNINVNSSGIDIYTNNLSGYKPRQTTNSGNANSGIAIPGSINAPAASIVETDVQNITHRQVLKSTSNAIASSAFTQTSSKVFKTFKVDNSALQQNIPKADISATLKSRTSEVSNTTTKTKAKTTTLADKKGPQKGKPNGPGANLPVGEGWIMLLMLAGYVGVLRFRLADR